MRRSARILDSAALIGLGVVFLVNALGALVQPEDFERLVAESAFDGLAGTSWLPTFIGLNDLAVGIGLIAVVWLSRFRPVVMAWAGVWLLAVSAVRLTAMT